MSKGTHVFLCLFIILPLLAGIVWAEEPDPVERQLRAIFEDPAYYRALWAVKIQSLQTGAVLYERNADKLVLPASSMKILTAFAAIERLGLDFKFETRVATDGVVKDGSLMGNIIVVGGGDPTLGARLSSPDPQRLENGDPIAVFEEWAAKLQSLGIQRINGDIIGDDSVFDRVPLGLGWAWDDLPYGYSAEVGGLPYNENVVLLRLTPASSPQGRVSVESFPATSYLSVRSELETVPAWEEADYRIQRRAGTNQAVLAGTVVTGSSPFWVSVAVDNPTLYFVTVFKETLERQGIQVTGTVRDIDDLGDRAPGPLETLIVHRSPNLAFIIQVLLKTSSNLYAESLIRMLDQHVHGKSFDEGREEVEEMLTRIGVPSDSYVLADGSGLSRNSFLIFIYIVLDARWAEN